LVKQYATELHVSANHLNEVVKRITGRCAGNQIRERIVLEAKRKAVSPQTSMKEVAFDLGYDDMAHFSKFFKSVCGKNFSTFKKERFLQLP
jgi:AraC-like DNA-binding protein